MKKKKNAKQSIIPNNDEYCYLCKMMGMRNKASDRHHMLFGSFKRQYAEEDGLYVNLCHIHHMMLHQQGYYKKELQQLAEDCWLHVYGKTIPDFIERYGMNYLDDTEGYE